MSQIVHLSRALCFIIALLMMGCTAATVPESSQPTTTVESTTGESTTGATSDLPSATIELLGVITLPNNTVAFDTPVGGLSAIAYDRERDLYVLLSDDRANFGPSRIYQATLDISDGALDQGDFIFTGMIPLLDEQGNLFGRGAIDSEGLALSAEGFFVSTEGEANAQPPIAPAILRFDTAGRLVASLPLPAKFLPLPSEGLGVRENQGLESLTLSPDGRFLISAVENALWQDGPATSLEQTSPARLLTFDLADERVVREQVYVVEKIPVAPSQSSADQDNGLVELIALEVADDGQGKLLAMERSYVEGVGNTIRIYQVDTAGATDVSPFDRLVGESYTPVAKQLLADLTELGSEWGSEKGIAPDNVEGLALGPQLPDGRHLLVAISDNNFNPSQTMQLWAMAITLD